MAAYLHHFDKEHDPDLDTHRSGKLDVDPNQHLHMSERGTVSDPDQHDT